MTKSKTSRCMCAALLALLGMYALAQAPAVTPPVVDVAPVELASVIPQVRAAGTVLSTRDAKISAEVPGRLVVVAEVGDRVKQGEAVAVIDDRVWRLQRENDDATIRRLQANLAYMERQQERLAALARQNNMAQAELDELRAKREMVAQEVESAKIQLARTEYDLSRAKVVAPFDGVIAERYQAQGEYTKQGDDVIRLVDTASLEVSARAPISATRHNREGALVQVTGDFGAATLPIRSLVKVGDMQSRLIEVRLPVGGLDWVIGEPVEVLLATGERKEQTAVPRDALVLRKSSAYVFRVDGGTVARKVSVVMGEAVGELVTVSGELEAEDLVVVLAGEILRDGQTVTLREGSVAGR